MDKRTEEWASGEFCFANRKKYWKTISSLCRVVRIFEIWQRTMTRYCDFVLVISWWLVSYWNNEVGDVKMYGDLMEDLYVYDDMIHFQHAVHVRDISRSMQQTDVAIFASDAERSIRFIFKRDQI